MPIEAFCPEPTCRRRHLLPDAAEAESVRCDGCGATVVADASATRLVPPGTTLLPAESVPADGSAASGVGKAFGRSLVRSRLGAGAFGTVYRAYDPHLDREVALKVPNPGAMDTPPRVERFLREAKAAARLRHPHIVPVFDAGRDGDGYYIASAFVDGVTLAESIPEGGTDFPRAGRLARELAEALAYAHDQGVVHRDVKPQNVMVDGRDRVHLMDFGLAARHDEEARLTADGTVMGTPAYMAPEQARGLRGEIGPAADQYAVGVVLYELLAGRTPFVGPMAAVLHAVAHTRPESPRKFRPGVPNDLETICLKALAKRPADRYGACHLLAADLRRWQEGEPIAARPLGVRERLARWVKKEPKLAAAVAAVALTLLLGVAGTTLGLVRADRARREAEGARRDAETAQREAEAKRAAAEVARLAEADQRLKAEAARKQAVEKEAEANAVVRFFEEKIFVAAGPKAYPGGLGHDVTLRAAIAASLPALAKSFAAQPLVEARLRSTLGSTFWSHGEHAEALAQLELARPIYAKLRGPDHPDTLSCTERLANNYSAVGRHADAVKLKEEVVAARTRLLAPDHPATLASKMNVAISYGQLGRHADAIGLFEETLAAYGRAPKPDRENWARTMNNLASTYSGLGRHTDALELNRKALALYEEALPPGHGATLWGSMCVGHNYFALGLYAEALEHYEELPAAYKRVLGPDHPVTLTSMSSLAGCYEKMDRRAEADKLRAEVAEARKRTQASERSGRDSALERPGR